MIKDYIEIVRWFLENHNNHGEIWLTIFLFLLTVGFVLKHFILPEREERKKMEEQAKKTREQILANSAEWKSETMTGPLRRTKIKD